LTAKENLRKRKRKMEDLLSGVIVRGLDDFADIYISTGGK
jgi:hypothetical protein